MAHHQSGTVHTRTPKTVSSKRAAKTAMEAAFINAETEAEFKKATAEFKKATAEFNQEELSNIAEDVDVHIRKLLKEAGMSEENVNATLEVPPIQPEVTKESTMSNTNETIQAAQTAAPAQEKTWKDTAIVIGKYTAMAAGVGVAGYGVYCWGHSNGVADGYQKGLAAVPQLTKL